MADNNGKSGEKKEKAPALYHLYSRDENQVLTPVGDAAAMAEAIEAALDRPVDSGTLRARGEAISGTDSVGTPWGSTLGTAACTTHWTAHFSKSAKTTS